MLARTFIALAVLGTLASQAGTASVPDAGQQTVEQLQGRANSKKGAKHHPATAKHPKKKHAKHPKHPKHKHPHPHPHPHPTGSPASSAQAQPTATTPASTPAATPPPIVKSKIVCTSPSDSTVQNLFNIPYAQYYQNQVDMFSNVKHIRNGDDDALLTIIDDSLDTVANSFSPSTMFDLMSCTSTYMGYDPFVFTGLTRRDHDALTKRALPGPVNNRVWYGRLQANNMLNMCLTAYHPDTGSDRVAFQLAQCSDDDDQSQITQFFRTSYDNDNNKVVQYLGAPYSTANSPNGLHYNIVPASLNSGCPLGNTIQSNQAEASFYAGKLYVDNCC